jgi:hypothetical protein
MGYVQVAGPETEPTVDFFSKALLPSSFSPAHGHLSHKPLHTRQLTLHYLRLLCIWRTEHANPLYFEGWLALFFNFKERLCLLPIFTGKIFQHYYLGRPKKCVTLFLSVNQTTPTSAQCFQLKTTSRSTVQFPVLQFLSSFSTIPFFLCFERLSPIRTLSSLPDRGYCHNTINSSFFCAPQGSLPVTDTAVTTRRTSL